ncbi:MAG TPA: TerC family protein [Tepidisphaeraceae bacterium]|nr:TerC family protein [Tepidisphaeraceae bacterium]
MIWIWIGFVALILVLLALDLGVFNRKDHVFKVREALGWSAFWISLGLAFTVFVYFCYERHWLGMGLRPDPIDGEFLNGHAAVVKYLTGYVIEKSLSVDNIFVIALIFTYLKIPAQYQHRVLFWGIVGAIAMRGLMIWAGAALVQYHWVIWLFGGFLIFTGIRMAMAKDADHDLSKNRVLKAAKRVLPFTDHYHGHNFTVVEAGKRMFTPLALALVMVEATDVVFAVDSIPAIFAITGEPFLVFTSNIFAILGLRSLYFALAGMMDKFRYLKLALAVVLVTVGVKMLTAKWLKLWLGEHFNVYLLGAVFLILIVGVVASIRANRRDTRNGKMPHGEPNNSREPVTVGE